MISIRKNFILIYMYYDLRAIKQISLTLTSIANTGQRQNVYELQLSRVKDMESHHRMQLSVTSKILYPLFFVLLGEKLNLSMG